MELISVEHGSVVGKMPVDARTHQPYGLLHGGASVVLAETLGSVGSHFIAAPKGKAAVGIEVNANHLRGVKSGWKLVEEEDQCWRQEPKDTLPFTKQCKEAAKSG